MPPQRKAIPMTAKSSQAQLSDPYSRITAVFSPYIRWSFVVGYTLLAIAQDELEAAQKLPCIWTGCASTLFHMASRLYGDFSTHDPASGDSCTFGNGQSFPYSRMSRSDRAPQAEHSISPTFHVTHDCGASCANNWTRLRRSTERHC
jgi:hypothetical protein